MKKDRHRDLVKGGEKNLLKSSALDEEGFVQGRDNLTLIDYIAAPLIAVLAGILTFPHIGTSIEWDDLFYMNVSQYTTPQAWVLNRYGHIYFQKLFFWFCGDAITGTKVYWCFIIFGTVVLIYWCAKILAGKRAYVIGAVAVSFFISLPLWARYAGCTFSDFTVMFVVMLGSFVYLAFFTTAGKYRHWIIMLMGLIFFWAVKSKETGVSLGVLFFGLGQGPTGVRSISRSLRDIGWVCVGMAAGCLVLMVLDLTFISDALFSIRPSSIKRLFSYNTGEFEHDVKNSSWFTILSFRPIIAAFLLYLLAGWKRLDTNWSRYEKFVWLIPLATMFFLTMSCIKIRCSSYMRYLPPALPLICVFGAQLFRFKLGGSVLNKKDGFVIPKLLVGTILVILAFLIVLYVMDKTPGFIDGTGWESFDRFYSSVILTLSTIGLLMCAAVSKKRSLTALFISSLCLFFVIYLPLQGNLASLKDKVVAKKSEWRYGPYRVFANDLRFDKDVKILVSKDVHKRSWMLGREVRSHSWLFNVYFNQKFDVEQFIDGTWDDILKGDYTYGFLTLRDWKGLSEKHNVDHLMKRYQIESDKSIQIILLKKR